MNDKVRVVLFGATGLVGAHILNESKSGIEIVGSTRIPKSQCFVDFSKPDSIEKVLDRIQPDCIINCAGITAIDKAAETPELTRVVNVQSVEMLAAWCARNNVRLIHFSTDFVYDGELDYFSESSATNPLSVYGLSKLSSEKVALELNQNTVVIRTSLVYGFLPKMSRMNFPLFVKSKLEQDFRLNITADQFRSPTYAGDLARGVLSLVTSGFTGVLHLSGPERISVYDFALLVADQFKLSKALLNPVKTGVQNVSIQRPLSTGLNIDLAQKLLDYNPLTPARGLEKISQMMMSN